MARVKRLVDIGPHLLQARDLAARRPTMSARRGGKFGSFPEQTDSWRSPWAGVDMPYMRLLRRLYTRTGVPQGRGMEN